METVIEAVGAVASGPLDPKGPAQPRRWTGLIWRGRRAFALLASGHCFGRIRDPGHGRVAFVDGGTHEFGSDQGYQRHHPGQRRRVAGSALGSQIVHSSLARHLGTSIVKPTIFPSGQLPARVTTRAATGFARGSYRESQLKQRWTQQWQAISFLCSWRRPPTDHRSSHSPVRPRSRRAIMPVAIWPSIPAGRRSPTTLCSRPLRPFGDAFDRGKGSANVGEVRVREFQAEEDHTFVVVESLRSLTSPGSVLVVSRSRTLRCGAGLTSGRKPLGLLQMLAHCSANDDE